MQEPIEYEPREDVCDELEGDLRSAVRQVQSRPIPEAALSRSIEKALNSKELHSVHVPQDSVFSQDEAQPKATVQVPPTNDRKLKFHSLRRAVLTCAAATIAAVAVIGWIARPRVSFADVADAVFKRPWIHVVETYSDGTKRESWFSPAKDISARRHDDWIEYHDHPSKIYYSYDVAKKTLYRVPEHTRRHASRFASIVATFQVLLQDEQPTENPLQRMEFLGEERFKMKVLSQQIKRIEDDGRAWLDYRFTVRYDEDPNPIEMLIRVDPQTKLLHLSRMAGVFEGKRMKGESRFNYPDSGPSNIYDLGVPEMAKLVDRVPKDDIARILTTLRAGRQRMDNYRALIVERTDREYRWWAERPLIVYRKGDKFRIDRALKEAAKAKKPSPVEDMATWWNERSKGMRYYTKYILHGTTRYTCETLFERDADGSQHAELKSVTKHDLNTTLGEMYPPYYARLPEFACRPPLGIPNQVFDPALDTKPTEGPPGSILLQIRRTGRIPQARSGSAVPQPDAYRFWLDPERDFVVVRWDNLDRGAAGDEKIMSSRVIEEFAKSPQGIWYATRIRRKNAVGSQATGEVFDDLRYIYIDFNAELPDSLFEIPKLGRIH